MSPFSRHSRLAATIVASLLTTVLDALQDSLASPCAPPTQVAEASPREIRDFFIMRQSRVVSFFGYAGSGYEDEKAMLREARAMLSQYDAKNTVINIGATAAGIGAVYDLAKSQGFTTSGIVSTQARDQGVALSHCVDYVFYVKDLIWGGYIPGSTVLSPTSEAMVSASDVLIAIGGGEVAREELLAARGRDKPVTFIPADMNHRLARETAATKGRPEPSDYRGAVHAANVFTSSWSSP